MDQPKAPPGIGHNALFLVALPEPEVLAAAWSREHAALLLAERPVKLCDSGDPNGTPLPRERLDTSDLHNAVPLSSGLMGEGPAVERNRSAMPAVVLLCIGGIVAVTGLVALLAWLS